MVEVGRERGKNGGKRSREVGIRERVGMEGGEGGRAGKDGGRARREGEQEEKECGGKRFSAGKAMVDSIGGERRCSFGVQSGSSLGIVGSRA
jgi:hypothetical protein